MGRRHDWRPHPALDAIDWNALREIVSQQPLLVSPVLKQLESTAHPSTTDAARLRTS